MQTPWVLPELLMSWKPATPMCIWKSLSGVGRTYLHDIRCPVLGESKFNNNCIAVGCERMVAAEYLRTGIISKLREGFRSIGLTSHCNGMRGKTLTVVTLLSLVKLQDTTRWYSSSRLKRVCPKGKLQFS